MKSQLHTVKHIFLFILCFVVYKTHARPPYIKEQNDDQPQADKIIINGVPTVPGRYPYQVGLRIQNSLIFCGGTLISPEWVLTAAHCTGASHVLTGVYDQFEITDSVKEIEVAFQVTHPDYDEVTFSNDIMLIRLAQASSYSPITLDNGSTDISPGTNVTTMGWGTTESGFRSDILMEVEVDIVNTTECNSMLSYNGEVEPDIMICAAREGKDACQGDSGGPLIIKGENSASDIQIGVTSWGHGCAQPAFPGVYALVHPAGPFIENTMMCNYENGENTNSFGRCCSDAICVDGFYSCVSEQDCSAGDDERCLTFQDDGFDYSSCNQDYKCWVGDGICDVSSNIPECNYDGGDCCKDTCDDCGILFPNCIDPKSSNDVLSIAFQYFTDLWTIFFFAIESLMILLFNQTKGF